MRFLLVALARDGDEPVRQARLPLDFVFQLIRSELWRIASDVSLEHNVVLSPRVFGQARWDEARRMRLPLYRAIVEDGVSLSPERNPQ